MRKTLLPALLALLLAAPLASAARAATLAGVTLPDKADINGQNPQGLVLNGLGLRTKLFIKVYVGGLYLPQKEKSAQKVMAADAARQMLLSFIYDVSKSQMCDAWDEGLEANTPNASAEVKKNFKTLCTWMDGVGKGQKLVLTYLPAEGTRVEVGGKAKGTLPGKPTADAILATWIGANPAPGKDFKNAVLGQ
ncbi:MAG TPA: chalcone isomerase family protein [Thermoanaerobaculia bacterium]